MAYRELFRLLRSAASARALMLAGLACHAPAALALCDSGAQGVLAEQGRHDQGIGIDPIYDRLFQEFVLDTGAEVTAMAIVVSRPGNNSDRDLTLAIHAVNDEHQPLNPIAGTAVIKTVGEISETGGWVTFTLPSPVRLDAGNYALHLQLGAGTSLTGYHWWREYDAADPYPAGISGYWYPFAGGRWVTTTELDNAFRIVGCTAATPAVVPATGAVALVALALLLVRVRSAAGRSVHARSRAR